MLVPDAVPGDLLEVLSTGKRRGAQRGKIVTIIEPSSQRVAPPCPVASECGGCSLQPLTPEDQANLKSQWVREAFATVIDASTEWLPAKPVAGRRRRVRWSVGCDEAGHFLGFRARASHHPVRQGSCMVVTPQLDGLRQSLESAQQLLSGIRSIQAVQLHDGIHVVIEGDTGVSADAELPVREVAGLPIQWWHRDNHSTRPLSRPVMALHDRLPGPGTNELLIEIGPDDFIQAEEGGNLEMIRQIGNWAGDAKRVGDLFSGVGNLSLSLAAAGAEVTGGEVNVASVRAANRNAKRLNVQAKYLQMDLFGKFDPAPFTGLDLLVLDPPRKGARRACSLMGRMLPRRIAMVSCDPAAGARDAETLCEQGYRLRALRALDLFPYAGHVEAMSLWSQS